MISIDDAKRLSETSDLRQVIIFGWDGARTHVVTYGKSVVDSAQAAAGANVIKRGWEWPDDTIVEPERIQALHDRIAELEEEVEQLTWPLGR
jgi:hypothetical protein